MKKEEVIKKMEEAHILILQVEDNFTIWKVEDASIACREVLYQLNQGLMLVKRVYERELEAPPTCSFCQEPSAGGSMVGVSDEKGEPVYCCWRHFLPVRTAHRFKSRRLEKEKKRWKNK